MPEMRFNIRWPDGRRDSCYSPSLVVKDHLAVGQCYELSDFLVRCRTALAIASERVRARYGHPCGFAQAQLAEIESSARGFAGDTQVCVEAFEE